ncbi:uncharacterized protein LOC129718569 [Wyeomyia smithii]|uniref:uncharacterized protein LOC129718569 n=1 Tax=Wyeomyia smithii TaxID=174621 RepID=UPI0024681556|nr:uncharacterized protein LOC129718569 [Wyeomyia smithii]
MEDFSDSANKESLSQRKCVEEIRHHFEKLRDEYERNLQKFYSLKAQEWILEHHMESWKHLCEELDAKLATKQEEARNVRVQIWKDREDYCALSAQFANDFSIEATLAAIKRFNQPYDDGGSQGQASNNQPQVRCPHLPRIAEIDKELEKLQLKETELNRMELELAPDEETIRLLQQAVTNSASNLEELEAEIKELDESGQSRECTVKSILKRPCFVQPDSDRKQVRFE